METSLGATSCIRARGAYVNLTTTIADYSVVLELARHKRD